MHTVEYGAPMGNRMAVQDVDLNKRHAPVLAKSRPHRKGLEDEGRRTQDKFDMVGPRIREARRAYCYADSPAFPPVRMRAVRFCTGTSLSRPG
jgi:hypothetical protein